MLEAWQVFKRYWWQLALSKAEKVFGRSFPSVTFTAVDYLPTLVLLFIARFRIVSYVMPYEL